MLVHWESWSSIGNQVSKRIPRTNNCCNKQLDPYSQNLKWLRVSMKQFFWCVLNVDDLVIWGHTRYFSTTQSYIPHLHGANVNDGWRVTYIDWHSNRKDHPLSSISLEPGYIGICRQLEMWWFCVSKYLGEFLTWKWRLGHQVYNIFDIMWSINSTP
jgi:hypothetical protein